MRLQDLNKGFVRRVGEIDFPICFRSKRDEKTVGKPLVEVLRAVVCAPFKAFDFFDLLGQGPKGVLYLFHFGWTTAVLELEQYCVT